jgi:hypothetical protein
LANQLLIPEPSIIKKTITFCKKQYEIRDLQLTIDDYMFISQFNVANNYKKYVILGSTWMETLGTFILNMNKFLTFSYKQKKTMLQVFMIKPFSKAPSSENSVQLVWKHWGLSS